jgi:hypothetical protein
MVVTNLQLLARANVSGVQQVNLFGKKTSSISGVLILDSPMKFLTNEERIQ